jgi:hypothetical protein
VNDDRWEISALIARYAELLNLGQIEEIGELFRYGRVTSENSDLRFEGTEEVTAMYRNSVVFPKKLPDTLLFTTNLQISVEGDRATSKAYFLGMHQAGASIEPVIAGRYHDEFRRVDGTWWFEHRHMIPDMVGDMSTHLTESIDDLASGGAAGETA